MIWNYTDASKLTMKELNLEEIKSYLKNKRQRIIYGVYQIEAGGRHLFSKIEGDENSIMGLPIKKIKDYLSRIK